MNKSSRIYIAGHTGLVGSAIMRLLQQQGYTNLLFRPSAHLDLRNSGHVRGFFVNNQPEYVFNAAGKVGGIMANSKYPAAFIHDNIMMQMNLLEMAHFYGVKKMLFLGSSCIYPKHAPQPITEEALMTGPLEATNDAYAIAKIAGIKGCQAYRQQYGSNFICAMPSNLYGIGDNYDPQTSHVLPALIRKFHEAKERQEESVLLWGTGTPRREFLFADDLASACLFLMQHYDDSEIINVGTGADYRIDAIAKVVAKIVGYDGKIFFDNNMPDGTPRKLLDTTKLNKLGWWHSIGLDEGASTAYLDFFKKHCSK